MFSGCLDTLASSVMLRAEVLVAKMELPFRTPEDSSSCTIFFLMSMISTAASMMTAQSLSSSFETVPTTRSRAALCASLSSRFFFSCPSNSPWMKAMPLATASSEMSFMTVRSLFLAAQWAMPDPMTPAPRTPTVLVLTASSAAKWAAWVSIFLHRSWRKNRDIIAFDWAVTHMSMKPLDSTSMAESRSEVLAAFITDSKARYGAGYRPLVALSSVFRVCCVTMNRPGGVQPRNQSAQPTFLPSSGLFLSMTVPAYVRTPPRNRFSPGYRSSSSTRASTRPMDLALDVFMFLPCRT
mmetsp:Transcript_111845/g.194178  ORF Transcript_111845/g.194178 Transcript_111845/m.194178 type:complete len:296 (+) Transcript_111845:975-1862(+)